MLPPHCWLVTAAPCGCVLQLVVNPGCTACFWLFRMPPFAGTCLLSLQALVAVLMFLINSCFQGGVQPSLDSKQMVLQVHTYRHKNSRDHHGMLLCKTLACARQCKFPTQQTQQTTTVQLPKMRETARNRQHCATHVQPNSL